MNGVLETRTCRQSLRKLVSQN